MKEDIKREAVAGIDDALIRAAYKPEKAAAPTGERRHTGLKRAVLIAAAAILTVCGLLMFNANVRAAILGVFVRQEDDLTVVSFAGSETDDESAEHKTVFDASVGYVPEGLFPREMHDEEFPEEYRLIYLLDETAEDPYNQAPKAVRIAIASSRLHETKIHPADAFEDRFTPTTIRGMNAFIYGENDYYLKAFEEDENLKRLYEQMGIEPSDIDGGSIFFGDSDVTVSVSGYGLSIDELIRIAESVVW